MQLAGLMRAVDWVASRTGWTRLGLAFVSGLGAAASLPPVYALPLLLIVFPAVILMLDGLREAPLKNAALMGWSFGFGFFLGGIYWVGFAFLVDAEDHAWLLPFVALLFPGGLALFFAAAFAAARYFWTNGPERVLTLTLCLILAEWLRGHILTGFPWNLIGYAWGFSDAMLQSASLFGIYGLTLLTTAAACALAALVSRRGWNTTPAAVTIPALMAGLLIANFAFGMIRLADAGDETVQGVHLRIVQPNTPQEEKYVPHLRWQNWLRLLELTNEPGLERISHVIWPEAAPPFLLDSDPDALAMIAEILPPSATLMTGAVRVDRAKGEDQRGTPYNAFQVIDNVGKVMATYDKAHLVPFGEYLPFADFFEAIGIRKIVVIPGSFGRGPGPRTIKLPDAPPFGPLICYEIIFPGAVTDPADRPQWLINVTDDSWFKNTSGPRQHLVIARVRAIEEGLPVIRAANTGISAVIDAYGRVRARIDYGRQGILDESLPVALSLTIAVNLGGYIFAAFCLSLLGWAVFLGRRATPQV
ncbi:MAG: apolipoprotein N-acyltransferase [Alphaproteobacteria bacterium]|nr:apolipoprotein N-acyltransferase [Alphaproteobacteria bacterium]